MLSTFKVETQHIKLERSAQKKTEIRLYFNLQVKKIKIIKQVGGGKRKKQIENFQEQRRIYIHLYFHHTICLKAKQTIIHKYTSILYIYILYYI